MKRILFFSLIGILINGCVFKTELPQTTKLNPPINEPKNATIAQQYTDYSEYSTNNGSCSWRTKDSITCRIKRIQNVLGDLESNAVSAVGGIGNCRGCN